MVGSVNTYKIARAVELADDAENERIWAEYYAREDWIAVRTEEIFLEAMAASDAEEISEREAMDASRAQAKAEAARGAWMKREDDEP